MANLTEEEKKLLSKHKYIYEVYVSEGTLHAERFPVIYINKEFAYFKRDGNPSLGIVEVRRVSNDLYGTVFVKEALWGGVSTTRAFAWSIPEDFDEKKNEVVEEIKRINAKKYREKVEKDFKRAQKNYESYKKAYEELFGKDTDVSNKPENTHE